MQGFKLFAFQINFCGHNYSHYNICFVYTNNSTVVLVTEEKEVNNSEYSPAKRALCGHGQAILAC